MKYTYLLLFPCFLVLSCTFNNEGSKERNSRKVIAHGSEEWQKIKEKEAKEVFELQKKKYPSFTYEVVPVNGDTLIAATKFSGLIMTINAGQTWSKMPTPGLITHITIDNRRQLWGLHSWKGIHEADFCILYLSKDLGHSWKKYTVDPDKILAVNFYSLPTKSLKVLDFNNRIYNLRVDKSDLEWTLIDSIPKNNNFNRWKRKSYTIDSKGRKWVSEMTGIYLVDKDTTKVF